MDALVTFQPLRWPAPIKRLFLSRGVFYSNGGNFAASFRLSRLPSSIKCDMSCVFKTFLDVLLVTRLHAQTWWGAVPLKKWHEDGKSERRKKSPEAHLMSCKWHRGTCYNVKYQVVRGFIRMKEMFPRRGRNGINFGQTCRDARLRNQTLASRRSYTFF